MTAGRVKIGAKARGDKDITVTYENVRDGRVVSRLGFGRTFLRAREDADSRLPSGEWQRLVVSSPQTIFSDLQNQGRIRVPALRKLLGEGERVIRS